MTEGVGGGSDANGAMLRVLRVLKFEDVCKLKLLGFLLGFGNGGFTNAAGEAGAEACCVGSGEPSFSAKPLAFLGFLGEGEVIGRSNES
jgi:hypothetical protein